MIFCFALFMDKKIIFERSIMFERSMMKESLKKSSASTGFYPARHFRKIFPFRPIEFFPNCLSPIEFFQHVSPDRPGHLPGRKFPPRSSPLDRRLVHKVKKNALMPWHKDDVPPWFHLNFVLFSLCRGKGRRILRRAVSPCSRRRAACTLPRSLDTLWTGTCLLDPDMSLCLIL